MNQNPAGQLAREMSQVEQQNGGRLTPASVLKFAEEHRKSAIYSRIKSAGLWDDSKAAHRARLFFCQQLIMRVRVRLLVNGEKVSSRGYVNVVMERKQGGGYISLVEAMRSKHGRDQILETALFELQAFQRKYSALKELAPVFAAIRNIEKILVDSGKVNTAAA